jgi:hypothetical protein
MRYRNHNQHNTLSFMYRRIKSLEKLKYKARTGRLSGKMLESGFYEDQTHGALQKAWIAYVILCKKDDFERKRYYAAVIQKLQRELGKTVTDFPELRLMALDFYQENRDSLPDDLSGEEVLELMRKGDSEFWKRVRGEES